MALSRPEELMANLAFLSIGSIGLLSGVVPVILTLRAAVAAPAILRLEQAQTVVTLQGIQLATRPLRPYAGDALDERPVIFVHHCRPLASRHKPPLGILVRKGVNGAITLNGKKVKKFGAMATW